MFQLDPHDAFRPDWTDRLTPRQMELMRMHKGLGHPHASEQFALLFRDYLRRSPEETDKYADVKRHLARIYREDRLGYTNAKKPIIWEIMQMADKWAQEIGWVPCERDA